MFLYNITHKVDNSILQQWLQWQVEEHIPEIMATHLFTENKLYKLLEQDDNECSTYVVQYFTTTRENYEKYLNEYAFLLRKKAYDKWGDNFIAFRTFMELVQ